MLNTAIITWNSFYNYGTCLQAFALQHYIMSLGYENHIIDDSKIVYDSSVHSDINPAIIKWKERWRKAKECVHANYRSFYHFQRILCPGVHNFKAQYLKIDYNIDLVLANKADYDVYICGSDQIWNPIVLTDPKRTFYYAEFTHKPKISYAPSIGIYTIPDEWKHKVAGLISTFYALSVREESGQAELQELTSQKIELVVDPTLLLSKREWESLVPDVFSYPKEKYVLGYLLTPNQTYYKTMRDYARQHGMKLYLFMLNLEDYGEADKLISGGPFEFLHYVKNAEMVFTDSYHGTIFSAIFETPFYTFKRFCDDSPINQNSRIDTLLKIMGAEDRLIDGMNNKLLSSVSPDFCQLKSNLAPMIEHSKNYLRDNLMRIEKSII